MWTLNNSGDQTDCLRLGVAQLRNGQWCSELMSKQATVTMLTAVGDSKVRQMSNQWEHHTNIREEGSRPQGLQGGLDSKTRYLKGKKGDGVMKISEFCSC